VQQTVAQEKPDELAESWRPPPTRRRSPGCRAPRQHESMRFGAGTQTARAPA
jgi:hypothetical protein